MASDKPVLYEDDVITRAGARKALAVVRIFVGFLFLWAFVDKTFGLGYMTKSPKAWINGGSPSNGFLKGAEGPFAGLLHALGALGPVADWLFMLGCLGIGVAFILGMGVKVASWSSAILLCFMYLAEFPPTLHSTNPLVDSHAIYIAVVVVLALTRAGDTWGLGRWWAGKVGDSWLR